MGTNYSKSHFQAFDPDHIGEIVATIGPSYVIYRESIVHNAVSGEVLVEIASAEMLSQFLIDIGVTNSVHKLVLTNHFKKIFLSGNLTSSDSTSTIANPIKFNSENKFNIAPGKYHIFLTHDWGVHGKNHSRVARINSILKAKFDLVTWFDEERMEGDVRNKMTSGIANSICLVVFITERYAGKISSGGDDKRDNCKFEFEFGLNHLGHHRVITVVLEEKMKNPNDWPKELKAEVGRLLYIGMTSDEETVLLKKCDELSCRVHGIISSLSVDEKTPFVTVIPDSHLPTGGKTVDVDADSLGKVDNRVEEVTTSKKSEVTEDVPITTIDPINVELVVSNEADAPISNNSESVLATHTISVESKILAEINTTLSDTKVDNSIIIDRTTGNDEELCDSTNELVPIVIDFGSFSTKAGFGAEENPRFIFPSMVGRPKHVRNSVFEEKPYYVGDEAQSNSGILFLHHPIKNKNISNWNDFEILLDYTIYEVLRVNPEKHAFLLVDSGFTKNIKERLTQLLFDNFHIPYLFIHKSAALATYATGSFEGLVVEFGEGLCRCVPVYDGYTLTDAEVQFQFGGQAVTENLKSLLLDKDFPYLGTIRTLSPSSLLEISREIKEKICCVRLGNEVIEEKAYELPDGQRISLGNERYLCTEPFFELDGGIQDCIVRSIMKCDIDIRRDLWGRIVLTGGSSCLPGFRERLLKEISSIKPATMVIRVIDDCPLAWVGGSIVSGSPEFQKFSVSKQEYDENGPSIIHRKCS